MPESLGEAVLDLRADNRGANRGIDETKRKAESLDQTFVRIGGNLSNFGRSMSTFVTLPLVAAGTAAFKLASDAQEASNKFEIVMGGSADRVRAGLKDLEAQIPLTSGELLNLAAGTQDLLVPMGLARDAGASMSLQFVELAGDISAFNNVPVAQVLADIKSGLVGSSEPLFKYGVDTRVAALEAVALANGLIKQGEQLDDVARAQAVLLQIQNQSTDAMGAAAREAGGAAQSTQFLFREIRQLGEELGTILIPMFVPVISGLRDMVTWFRELSVPTQRFLVKAGLVAAAIGPLVLVIGKLLLFGGKIAGMMTVNTAATVANTTATGANATAVGASGLAKALGTATLALAAFWLGWKAGEFLAEQLGIQENALANWVDRMREAFGAESIADIRASADAAAQGFGTYRDAAQIAADETARLAQVQKDELAAAMAELNILVPDLAGEMGSADPIIQALADTIANAPNALAPAFDKATAAALRNKDAFIAARIKTEELKQSILDARLEKVAANQAAQKLAGSTDKYAESAKTATQVTTDFLGGFKTGIGFIDNFITKGLGKLQSALGGLFGGGGGGGGGFNLGSLFGGLFGGGGGNLGLQSGKFGAEAATGFLGGLSGILGSVSSFVPIIGPLLSAFGGPLLSGLKSLGGKIFGGIKSLFGGPGAAELLARDTVAAFDPVFKALLTKDQLTEAGGELWKQQNIAQRDIIIALGGSVQDVEGIWAQFQDRAKDPESANAFQAFWDEKLTSVQALMAETGLTLEELKKKAVNEGKEAAEAQRATTQQTVNDTATAMQQMVADTSAAQGKIASIAIGAARATENAWVQSASSTISAWKAARASTVGFSSILDIEELGSEAARKLGDSQADAARRTEEEWKRVSRDLAMDRGHHGGDGDRRRRDLAMDRFDNDFIGGGDFGGGRGGGDGKIVIELVLDQRGGELIARKVVKLSPAIKRKLGLSF